jgi:hypothetical protein
MTEQPPEILIGRDRDGVRVRILGRMHPGAEDYDDGNWLVTPVQIRVGGFSGEIGADLRADEFKRFRQELERVYATLSGSAALASMDGWLSLNVSCLANGSLKVEGTASDRPGLGNSLEFKIPDMDQSFLPPLIDSLRDCERAYPVLGER